MIKIRPSFKVALVYFIIGVAWISISDQVLGAMTADPILISKLQTYKGWFFVVISAAVIYVLCSIYERSLNSNIRALKNANHDLKLFFYKASHDLRGPIKSILGLTRIIDLYEKDDQLPLAIHHIELSAQRADNLIYDLDQLTNIIEGPVQVAPVNFSGMIKKVIQHLKNRMEDLVAKTEFTKSILVTGIQSHPYLLQLIFEKLIENAVVYTAPYRETPKIEITVKEVSKSLVIQVKDNGIGIEDPQTDKIFSMFYKGTEASKGSGLGLYIAKVAVDRLEGQISAESIPRRGSTFTVRFKING